MFSSNSFYYVIYFTCLLVSLTCCFVIYYILRTLKYRDKKLKDSKLNKE